MIVVFLGPPGSGKGTQADLLNDNYGFYHFDTGSRLREEIASGSDLGKRIATFTNAGKLVPLDIIKELITSFFETNSPERLMFDGFPRNLDQAKVLDEALVEHGDDLDHAIYLEIDEDSLIERIINRRFCPVCGEIYNLISKPPKQEGRCDLDNAELTQRKDDTREVFGTRLQVYLEQTVPVLEYYRNKGVLRTVDGDHDIEEIAADVAEILGVS